MWNLKRILLGTSCAIAVAAPSLATAMSTTQAKSIRTTQRITTLFSSANGTTNVGTSDGVIAGATVHGALRAVSTSTGKSMFSAQGTLFYGPGTLSYTLHGTATTHADGSLTVNGSGMFTGGTSRYSGAHGSFTFTGAKPAKSFETWKLTGKVSYR